MAGKKIREGEISRNPLIIDGQHDSCTYCPYHSICGFDTSLDGFKYRKITSLDDEEIFKKILDYTGRGNMENTGKDEK